MPYAFLREETVPAGVRRIMDEQLVRAQAQLTDPASPLAERVHDARKRLKEIRALLRMIREPLGDQFAVENAWFRDCGRLLSGARDAEAVIEALEKLRKAERLAPTTLRRTRELLVARRDAFPQESLQQSVADVYERLTIARARVALWPQLEEGFDTLANGLRRTYRDGRRAMHEAAGGAMPQQFHEWRKRAKEHWYHAQLLRNAWPAMTRAWAETMSDLSHLLGDHHDLFVLRQIVAQATSSSGLSLRPRAGVALLDLIDARQSHLEGEALRIGRLVYDERPRDWLARIRNTWTTWRE
jgi:CHAD domain-containing protein